MGEGGAITTGDAALAERLRLFRNHGMTRDASNFAHHDMAWEIVWETLVSWAGTTLSLFSPMLSDFQSLTLSLKGNAACVAFIVFPET